MSCMSRRRGKGACTPAAWTAYAGGTDACWALLSCWCGAEWQQCTAWNILTCGSVALWQAAGGRNRRAAAYDPEAALSDDGADLSDEVSTPGTTTS